MKSLIYRGYRVAKSRSLLGMRLWQLHAPRSYQQQGWACISNKHMPVKCMHTPPIYTYSQAATHINTDTQSFHKHQQHQQPLPAPFSSWASLGCLSVYIYVYTHPCTLWTAPVAGLRQSLCSVAAPESQSPQLLAHGRMSPQGHSPTLAAGTDTLAYTHTHTQTGVPVHPQTSRSL